MSNWVQKSNSVNAIFFPKMEFLDRKYTFRIVCKKRFTFKDSSWVNGCILTTLTLFLDMTSSTVISWVVTSTLAQTSKLLMIWDDHTSSNIKRLLWYWPKKSFRRISLAYSTVVTDATWKILPQFVKRRQRDFPTFSRYDIFLENPQWLKITKKIVFDDYD